MKLAKNFTAIIISTGIFYALSLVGSDGGAEYNGAPIFMLAGGIVLLLHLLVFIPSYYYKTEHYFDLTGSLSYIVAIGVAWWLSPNSWNLGNIILALLIVIWAVRLGNFLFIRVKKVGKDSRFDTLKINFLSFGMVWVLSVLWVYVTFSAGLAALTSPTPIGINAWFVIGALLWTSGFVIETVADSQKYAFKCNSVNNNRFITHGLWAWSRHPNYFGEIVLWIGIAVMAFPVLSGLQYCTLISPVFVWLLLAKISGIPMLEAKANVKWGDNVDYIHYKDKTPLLLPKRPK